MIGRGISIIRINNKKLASIAEDEQKLNGLGYDIVFHIPVIEVVKPDKKIRLQNLLLNYGFMEAPLYYLRDMNILSEIRQASIIINSWFYRKGLVHNHEAIDLAVLLETISENKLSEILAASQKVSESYNSKEIKEGEYLILSDKPFEGLMVQVLSVSNKKIRVKFMISAEFVMELDKSIISYRKVYNPSSTSFAKEFIEPMNT